MAQTDKGAKRQVVSIFVDNQVNVLTRVVSLFGRRGYNLDSVTSSFTDNPGITNITIVLTGTDAAMQQIVAQVEKLEVVRGIYLPTRDDSIYRELLMMKIAATDENRTHIIEATEIYRGRVIDLSQGSMIIELTGSPNRIDGYLSMMEQYDIIEMRRTGITAMARKEKEFELQEQREEEQ